MILDWSIHEGITVGGPRLVASSLGFGRICISPLEKALVSWGKGEKCAVWVVSAKLLAKLSLCYVMSGGKEGVSLDLIILFNATWKSTWFFDMPVGCWWRIT